MQQLEGFQCDMALDHNIVYYNIKLSPQRKGMMSIINLMVAYLTDARLATVTSRERLCEFGALSSLLNPCARLDTRLHPGLEPVLDPGLGVSLEYECSVTQSPPGDYLSVKCWDGALILRVEPIRGKRTKLETLKWGLKALFLCF